MIHDEVSEALKRWVVDAGAAPGASASVGAFKPSGWRVASGVAGRRGLEPGSGEVEERTLYDLASLTKPLVAATFARVARSGAASWDEPLSAFLPELSQTAAGGRSLSLLASHRAGLEAHLVLGPAPSTGLDRARALRRSAEAVRPDCTGALPAAGFPPVYSDLGYILLGAALEARLGEPLDAIVRREVVEPLDLEIGSARQVRAAFGASAFERRGAPTERLVERGGQLLGQVHDDNAWWLSGDGQAGHAGLFGTAPAVFGFAAAVLDALSGRAGGWLGVEDVQPLVVARSGGSLRMGFDGKAETGSSAGERFGERAFGHLGFTGTSVWCDPDREVAVVLLTNRVCPSRDNVRIREIRPALHGVLFDLAAGL